MKNYDSIRDRRARLFAKGFLTSVFMVMAFVGFALCTDTYSTIHPEVADSYVSPSGKTFTTTGTYLDTIANASGCDSIITIHLMVGTSCNNLKWSRNQTITASDAARGDQYGQGIDIGAKYVVVGAPTETSDENGANSMGKAGSAYLLERSGSTWTEVRKLVASDRSGGSQFGNAVAVQDHYAIMGSLEHGTQRQGAAYIFDLDSSKSTEIQRLVAPTQDAFDYFGNDVAMYGDYAFVSAYRDNEDANDSNALTNAGAVYVYKNVAGTWNMTQRLCASDREASDFFGNSVAIHGDYAIVGAPGEDENASGGDSVNSAGSAYIFKNINGAWVEVQKIVCSDRIYNKQFGYSVAINNDYAVVGASYDHYDQNGSNYIEEAGSAYIFKNNGGTWTQVQKLVASDRRFYGAFGISVDISGDNIVIGAYTETFDTAGMDSVLAAGAAYLFRHINGTWYETNKIVASDRREFAVFGQSTAVFGDEVLVGATGGNGGKGAAYSFSATCDAWSEIDVETCDFYVAPSGKDVWFLSGTYRDTIPTTCGCDSFIQINLTVLPRPDVEVSTIAGDGTFGFADDTATAAKFRNPWGMVKDTVGNIYVADYSNNRIRKITPSGVVSTLAGGSKGFADGTGTAVKFNGPVDLAMAQDGDIYIADAGNNRIRKVTPAGVVTTVAGSTQGFQDGADSIARFNRPFGITFDSSGNLYVADQRNYRIRKITPSGNVSTCAGNGGDNYVDGADSVAQFGAVTDLVFDQVGNLYFLDGQYHTIRKLSTDGQVSTVAGSPNQSGFTDGSDTSARFSSPTAMDIDALGNILVTDFNNVAVRYVTPEGTVSTLFSSTSGFQDGLNEDGKIAAPRGILAYAPNEVYISDGNYAIRKLVLSPGSAATASVMYDTACEAYTSPDGQYTWFRSGTYYSTLTNHLGCDSVVEVNLHVRAESDLEVGVLAGSGVAGDSNGSGTAAEFRGPGNMDTDNAGNVYLCDRGNHRIRKITPSGVVTTYAGGTRGFADGDLSTARFNSPFSLRVLPDGTIYVADIGNHRIRKISPSGKVTTLAGDGTRGYKNGQGDTAQFNAPGDLTVDAFGNVYVSDVGNSVIRKVSPSGMVSTYAGTTRGYTDGPASTAQFVQPIGLELDRDGNLYVVDGQGYTLRKVSSSGVVSTVAGKPTVNGFADGADTAARFTSPSFMDIDDLGNIILVDPENHRIRQVTPEGEVTTLTGSINGYKNGPGDSALLSFPDGVCYDPLGYVYFTDASNRLRKATWLQGSAATHGGYAITAYDSFTSPGGKTWVSSGTVIDTTVNSMGCDSILAIDLTVIHRLYVDSSASSGGNGMSWNTPFKTLTDALNSANKHNEHNAIFMRTGTYYPVNHRDSSFEIINANVKIYGGFAGTEATPEDRQPGVDPTILCGDIGRKGDSTDNVYHVMIIRPDSSISDSSVILDGLTIQGGNANGNRGIYYGGRKIYQTEGAGLAIIGSGLSGEKLSPVITNCTFTGNHGDYASVFIQAENGVATPLIDQCDFINNTSKYGTIFNDGQGGEVSPVIQNCVFDGNYSATSGGAIYNYGYFGKASPTVISCVFNNNEAHSHGGAIYNNGYAGTSSPSITNATFNQNKAGQQAGMMYNFGNSGTCAPVVRNSISSGNSTNGDTMHKFSELYNYAAYPYVAHSSMQLLSSSYSSSTANSLNGGTSNLYRVGIGFLQRTNPRGDDGLWRTGDDGLRLNARSSWVNSGKNGIRPESDILGNQRNGNTDLGAYEYVDCGLNVALAKSTGTHTAQYAVKDGDYICYCNDDNELLLALDTNGSGAVISPSQVKLYIGNPSTINYNSSGGMISNPAGGVILERRWDVDPTTQPTGTVGVKYFYTNDNFNDLKTAMANLSSPTTLSSPTELQFYKVKGGSSATFPNPHDSGVYGIVLTNGSSADTNIWVAGKHGVQDHSAEYLVTSFSGGGGGGGGGSAPLPVDLVAFEATAAENHTAKLNWTTASELNNSHFVLERSYNGYDFEEIAVVQGQGAKNTPTSYEYNDRSIEPEQNKVFYRLRQTDFDGTTTLSPVRLIWYNATEQIARTLLFPNPTSGSVTLILPEDETDHSYKVLDNQGRILIAGTTGSSQETINLVQFPAGLYFVTIDTGESFKVVKK